MQKMLNIDRVLFLRIGKNAIRKRKNGLSSVYCNFICNMGRSLGIENKSGNSAYSCLNSCIKEVIVFLINQLQAYEF